MQLSIVTLNYNKSDLTIKCIKSLQSHYGKELDEKEFEIIIVDNNSEEMDLINLKEKIKSENIKNVTLVENKENVGFSKGCNIGAKSASGDVLLFLNNDTEVKDKGIVSMLEYIQSNKNVDILGGKLSNQDGSEQPSVGSFYTPLNAFFLLLGLQRAGLVNKNPPKISTVDWVKGGCMMVKREVFEKLSGFDENLFMYIEDMEFCYRAEKIGYGVYFFPHVTIEHTEQGSSNRSFAVVNIYQNLLYFYKKHRSKSEYFILKSILKTKATLLITIGKIFNNHYLISTYEKALKVA